MLPENTPKLTTVELLHLIEEAKNAELCRDTESLLKILQPIWNVDETPNFDNYEETIKAELIRLCGVFLSYYGKYSLNQKNYQIRGKDLLINAIEIFEKNKISDKAAEAKINLAFCYWNLGEVNETEAILDIVESDFSRNLLHPIYLRVGINRLMVCFWKQDIESAFKIIEEISSPMQFCNDVRLQAMFHNQAGIFHRAAKKYDKAVFHLNEAIRYAEEAKNKLFIAINFNNLAYLYKELKDFQKAFSCITHSIDEINNFKYKGFLPHALDTKALIYLDSNKPQDALETIDEAIELFKQGEDYRGLTESLWTKIRCLLRLDRSEEAIFIFGELYQTAVEQIGEAAAEKFAEKFAAQFYVFKHLPLEEELAEFKKELISKALIEANGVVGKAAEILQLDNYQSLSAILRWEFPELLVDLGFKQRTERKPDKSKNSRSETPKSNPHDELVEYKITRIILPDKNFSFDFKFTSPQFETYYFNKALMRTFGVELGAVVAVTAVKNPAAGMPLLIAEQDKFSFGTAEYDEWTGIYFIQDAHGNPIPIDEENLIGEAIGFCPVSNADDKYIKFSRFSF